MSIFNNIHPSQILKIIIFWIPVNVINLRPEHQFVPGMINPASENPKAISEAAGFTKWTEEQMHLNKNGTAHCPTGCAKTLR